MYPNRGEQGTENGRQKYLGWWHTEHVIHTATGWMLREVGGRDEGTLRRFLDECAAGIPHPTAQQPVKCITGSKRKVKCRTWCSGISHFIDAGLAPYQSALQQAGIPSAVFSGRLSDADRKQLVDDYTAGRVR